MMYYLQNSYMQMQADINGSATVICPEKIYLDICAVPVLEDSKKLSKTD